MCGLCASNGEKFLLSYSFYDNAPYFDAAGCWLLCAAGVIRVASTGPFTVSMTSANSYRMTYPGGNLATTAERIRYATRLLGQTRDSTNATFTTVACQRAGLTGENLPISVTLREGGQAKVPASAYRDTLTVTVTPLATPFAGSPFDCPSL